MSDLVPRDELRHALATRHELGPEYEDQIADALAEKIERRLAERGAVQRHGAITPLVLGSLGVAIPLIAIAGNYAGGEGVFAVCIALVLVNFFAARR
jgi:hypothetical protein